MKLPAKLTALLFAHMGRIANSRRPDVRIGKHDDTYMERWWVIPRNRFFDHRALHDHPWLNCSILLQGRYTEHTISAGGINHRAEYREGCIKLRGPRYAHRIELTDGPCWSLFITGPNVRDWGFHCPNGWRHWKEFTDPTNTGHIGGGCD